VLLSKQYNGIAFVFGSLVHYRPFRITLRHPADMVTPPVTVAHRCALGALVVKTLAFYNVDRRLEPKKQPEATLLVRLTGAVHVKACVIRRHHHDRLSCCDTQAWI
jgi:hypothetical protein